LGTTIADICEMCGAENTRAVQVGGPGGILVTPEEFDCKLSFDGANSAGSFIIFDETRNMVDVAVNFTHFFAHESCGFCTPCRVGTKLLVQLADKIAEGHGARMDIAQMERLHKLMTQASHCGLGQRAAVPLLTNFEKCPPCFAERMGDEEYTPAFDVEAAIERSRQIVKEEGRPR
jgi:[NiFe] hydrogenase diaphorase moiety large subunit